ncbi:MAG: hypothetical protein JSU70_11355 [Phycisphaerales bacterium]|nr:MAG: hypothetical protein JSU70_11355 [Phycisphaerales bacterium]
MGDSVVNNSSEHSAGKVDSASPLKQEDLAKLTKRLSDNHRLLKESLERLQRSLDHLRLLAKYQAFDLEATRRENSDLRRLLEEDMH